jgi:hypothetical protein
MEVPRLLKVNGWPAALKKTYRHAYQHDFS